MYKTKGVIAQVFSGLVSLFQPPTAPEPIPDAEERRIARLYRTWRIRTMYGLLIGYAIFYFCRKNISIAMPVMAKDLHLSNTKLGDINSLLYLTYAVGKLANGALGDHVNSRVFMVLGLVLTALMNMAFGASSSILALSTFWLLNGWFQSMGFPPCARLLAKWYSVSERGLMWGIWNTSHQIGAFAVSGLVGVVSQELGWRAAFTIPAAICIAGAAFLAERLRDTPKSMGLPPIATFRKDPEIERDGKVVSETDEGLYEILVHRVLTNPLVWAVSLLNFFVYVVRSGAFDFATKFLVDQKGMKISSAGWITGSFELLGIPGSLLAGYLSDRVFAGRRAPVCLIFLLMTAGSLWLFYKVPAGQPLLAAALFGLVGFAIYGPQLLCGVFATDVASSKAAATAVGLTGLLGYVASYLTSRVTGRLVDRVGWQGAFYLWIGAALVGALLTLPIFKVRPTCATLPEASTNENAG